MRHRWDLKGSFEPILERGRSAWPDLVVDSGEFGVYLSARGQTAPECMYSEDLYLAHACLSGASDAIEAFERAHFANLPSHLAQLSPPADVLEDVAQTLRERLFVAAQGKAMGLEAYTGRGPLGAWFRVTALNTALKLLRAEMRELRLEKRAPVAPPALDPEQELVKARTRADLEEALRHVLSRAPSRERALLRLHFLHGSTLEELTTAFNVSRATVVRWIADARQAVLQETQQRMVERLKLSSSELSGALRITRSNWTMSLEALLDSRSAELSI